ncbi:hypothetical protein DM01DRAFT_1333698 [Hesseltinella vesiculosa]|uniref:Uncharacterized protein n=1 Tax=Hesseltinella vesiculosa TaxID=101127 RepID=A0A1X2GNM0_9FUNG|nr:hypothetical protein DM01DRAFT_1333698 [Hesseltinella vesiculosa]
MLRWSLDCYFEKVDLDIVKMRLLPEDTTDLDGDRMPPSSTLFVSTAARQLLSMPALRQPPTSKTTSTSMVLPPAPTPSQYQRHRRFASVADQDSTKGHLVKYGGAQAQDRPSARVRSLEIRWQMLARPRSFFSHAHEKPTKHVEGVFIYTFDDQGYISEHKIQHIVPSPSRRILLLHSYGSKVRAFLESMKRREPVLRPGLG